MWRCSRDLKLAGHQDSDSLTQTGPTRAYSVASWEMHFYERNYHHLLEYLEDSNQVIPQGLAMVWIEQLVDNEKSGDIPMPPGFLTEEKVDIWMKLKEKMSDQETKKNIDFICIRWTLILNNLERAEYSRSSTCTPGSSSMTASSVASPAESMFSVRSRLSSFSEVSGLRSPAPALTVTEDLITQYFTYDIFLSPDSSAICGQFTYALKISGKYVCLQGDCKVPYSRVHKTRTAGVTLQTLRSHARKHHSINLNVKRKKAFLSQPFTCQLCNKHFARDQTLRNHVEKFHQDSEAPSLPPTDQNFPVLVRQVPAPSPLLSEHQIQQLYSQRNGDQAVMLADETDMDFSQ